MGRHRMSSSGQTTGPLSGSSLAAQTENILTQLENKIHPIVEQVHQEIQQKWGTASTERTTSSQFSRNDETPNEGNGFSPNFKAKIDDQIAHAVFAFFDIDGMPGN